MLSAAAIADLRGKLRGPLLTPEALAYDATRVTRDVDSLFVPHGVVLDEARNVAQNSGCPCGG